LAQKELKELMDEDIEGLKESADYKAAKLILTEAETYVSSTADE